ncbi:hypothetical protein LCGC14_1632210 [marine sediment metagenome]|uniref:Uncharacterized protein n=1 Tax=marine sediment metagenome TaxID=412755 RepID=A0A0F9I2A3_9ZZZZ
MRKAVFDGLLKEELIQVIEDARKIRDWAEVRRVICMVPGCFCHNRKLWERRKE